MKKLSEKGYWDSLYNSKVLEDCPSFLRRNIVKFLSKSSSGQQILNYIREYMVRSYADYILWDVIYARCMPKTKGLKVLEVGSAPGDYLVRLSQKFGFIPYGVEYSASGVKLNRNIFSLHNINPDNVIYADFLSDDFHKKYRGYFDIVISNGFIEHFSDVAVIIKKHINLLAQGGYLIVSMPNLRGINYILAWFFNRRFLSMHNISIMRMQKRNFLEMFNKEQLSTLFCGYYGIFDFYLFGSEKNSPLVRVVLNFCNKLQLILSMVFRLVIKKRGAESSLFSPYLIFIGVKK